MSLRNDDWVPTATPLAGKTALVAGGAGGIGEATTRLLAKAGARVLLIDFKREAAEKLAAEIKAAGGEAEVIVADLLNEHQATQAVTDAEIRFGGFDVLVNVAGGMAVHAPSVPIKEWLTKDWDHIVDLNLRYVFWTCRAALPLLERRGGGAIVNVTSINGMFGNPRQSAYGAAKAGLINFTQTLAMEAAQYGIRANSVAPGVTVTPAVVEKMPAEVRDRIQNSTPLKQLGIPADIAKAILFFATPMSEHITGQNLLVDGGIGADYPYFVPGTDQF